MHARTNGRLAGALLAAGLLFPHPLPAQGGGGGGVDAQVFEAVVEKLRGEPEGVLRVDPRPLRSGADLTSVEAGELSPAPAGRRQVLDRAGVAAADFVQDQRCLFARGLPHPPEVAIPVPDSVAQLQRRCREQPPFTSAVVGTPRPVPGGGEHEIVVPVARMTTSRYVVEHFHLRAGASGAVEVVRVESVLDVMS